MLILLDFVWNMAYYLCALSLCSSHLSIITCHLHHQTTDWVGSDVRLNPENEVEPLKITKNGCMLISDFLRKERCEFERKCKIKCIWIETSFSLKAFYLFGLFFCFGLGNFKLFNKRQYAWLYGAHDWKKWAIWRFCSPEMWGD